jgi:hypothetical protein
LKRIYLYGLSLLSWLPGTLIAQRVIYSQPFNARSTVQFRIIGRSGNFIWEEKQVRSNYRGTHDKPPQQSFILLDDKLRLIKETAVRYIPGAIKQWLIAGADDLDQVILTSADGKTKIVDNHYYLNENNASESRIIDSIPFTGNPSRFILVRSEDKSKILLLAFDNSEDILTRVHILLLNADCSLIYHHVMAHELFSQPCIQDDEIGFVSESFDNLPVKLADNGEWLMASPSRYSRNYSLFHACPDGGEFTFREIKLSPNYRMEDIAMSINNDQQEMSVGFLSAYQNSELKSVQVCNYSMKQGRFDFDTSYHFSTRYRNMQKKNISRDNFITVPGGGYMLLKEYGSPFDFENKPLLSMTPWETAYMLANYTESEKDTDPLKQGYRLNRGLSPIQAVKNQGDLNIFYFPSVSKDSTWSGTLDMEQHTEKNNPDLSYLLIPKGNKLYMLYNSLEGSMDPLATTTTLNLQGQPADDQLVFWEMNRLLNFQQSRRFSADEVAVPYAGGYRGFVIIRL